MKNFVTLTGKHPQWSPTVGKVAGLYQQLYKKYGFIAGPSLLMLLNFLVLLFYGTSVFGSSVY